jgi:hypothetical protein
VGLERGPLSLVSTTEELLRRNSSGFGLENLEYGRADPIRWPRDTIYPQKLALTSPTSGGRSAGIVRLRTKTTEFIFFFKFIYSGTNTWAYISLFARHYPLCSFITDYKYITEKVTALKIRLHFLFSCISIGT